MRAASLALLAGLVVVAGLFMETPLGIAPAGTTDPARQTF
jgi:hypothetical protein